MDLVESVCTYCGVGCDIIAHIENNKIVKVTAPKDGSVSEGKLCIKGKYGHEFLTCNNRIKGAKIKESFIYKNEFSLPLYIQKKIFTHKPKNGFFEVDYELAYEIAAWKLRQIKEKYTGFAIASIGGARTSCENAYIFQKFTRKVLNSPHIDNCARVCHAPSLKGMRATIGEGAATNPFSDIYDSEFLIIIGSNTTEAHPIVANKISKARNNGLEYAVIDVRKTNIFKRAKYKAIIPFESNLLILNMISYVIIKNELYDKEFVKNRVKGFLEFKESILKDPYANPDLFNNIKGYENLTETIKNIAKEYAAKRSMILWGLGVTQHLDGSYAVSAICNLALLCGNIGKKGSGLIPLRGQNNVQGACDMGALPYFEIDYKKPYIEGLKTPDIIDKIDKGEIKALLNMGEDISHIHTNLNKIDNALQKLEFLMVNEVAQADILKYADIIFGVKSGYEKEGVYINAERRLHLSSALVKSDLPDDWEVFVGIAKYLNKDFSYDSTKKIWLEIRKVAKNRFAGASYEKLKENRISGLQWPIHATQTKILHQERFRTKDGFGHLRYRRYFLRGQLRELLEEKNIGSFYLTTGRVIEHYNNSAQTRSCQKLLHRHSEDVLLVSSEDSDKIECDRVVLVSKYGKSAKLKIRFVDSLKKGTMFVSFHHKSSHINYLFGDECDELTKTARFKSIKVYIEK